MFIRSERLFLRPGWAEDWAELLALADDLAIARNLVQAPWPYGPENARALASRQQTARTPHFVITLPGAAGSRLVGCLGLQDERGEGEAELGVWIARRYWNNGYATEAVRALLSLARMLGHRRIVAGHFLDDGASDRVLAKAGFEPTGEFRPRHSMARKAVLPWRLQAVRLDRPADRKGIRDSDGAAVEAMRAA